MGALTWDEQLELDGDLPATADRLAAAVHHLGLDGDGTATRLAHELQRGGWLGKLRTRHVWEFHSGARGGAYRSGGRFIEWVSRGWADCPPGTTEQ
jgi:hypothetical protein